MDIEAASIDSALDISVSDIGVSSSTYFNTQYLTSGVAIKVKERVAAGVRRSLSTGSQTDEDETLNEQFTANANNVMESSCDFANTEEKKDSEKIEKRETSTDISTANVDCVEFADKVAFAKHLVDTVVEDTEEKMKNKESLEEDDSDANLSFQFFSKESFFSDEFAILSVKPLFTSWPLIGEFTIELAAYRIDDYLSSFKTDEEWLYVIYYLGLIKDNCSELHKFEAIFSLPTYRYPIPQATASLYFTIEVCRSKPSHCPVDVSFQYESFRFKHIPGISDFKEIWLHYILTSKITFFRTLTF